MEGVRPGVVDQDIYPARPLQQLVYHASCENAVRNVPREREDLDAEGARLSARFFQGFPSSGHQPQRRAFPCQSRGDGPPYPRARPRDERDLTLKESHRSPPQR